MKGRKEDFLIDKWSSAVRDYNLSDEGFTRVDTLDQFSRGSRPKQLKEEQVDPTFYTEISLRSSLEKGSNCGWNDFEQNS